MGNADCGVLYYCRLGKKNLVKAGMRKVSMSEIEKS